VKESDDYCRRQLLEDSTELATLNKLEAAALEAQHAAKAKANELQAALNEFTSIPTLADEQQQRLAHVKAGTGPAKLGSASRRT
jgi:hypothetical protein